MSVRPCGSADEAVGAVGVLLEVLGVAAGISAAMLRKENSVRVACPTGTSPPDVIGTEALRKVAAGYCTADVFDEPAHDAYNVLISGSSACAGNSAAAPTTLQEMPPRWESG